MSEPIAGQAVTCVRCGYDLRGLDPAGHCPECGLGIERSLALGKELADSRPGWIATLSAAAWLLAAPNMMLLLVVAVQVYLMNQTFDTYFARRRTEQLLVTLMLGLMALAALVHLVGAWLLTRAENPHAARRPGRRLAWALRLAALGPVVLMVATVPGTMYRAIMPLYVMELLAYTVPLCVVLECFVLRGLGRRVLSSRLTEYAAIVGWGYALTWLALPVLLWVGQQELLPRNTTHLVTALSFIAVVFFWVASVIMLVGFAVAFARAGRTARGAWTRADAAAQT